MVTTIERPEFAPPTTAPAEPLPAEILTHLDIRIGTIRQVEPVPASKKLYDLLVDVGEPEPRHILVAWRRHCQPEDLIGKQLPVCCNIAPRTMAGRLSQGRLLSTYDETDIPQLLVPERSTPPGTRVW
jgi:methionyl-tRNA synthetase